MSSDTNIPSSDGMAPRTGRRAVVAAIVFTGIAMLVSVTLWLVTVSDSHTVAGTVAPAAEMGGMDMSGGASGIASEPISLPDNAAALAAAHRPYPADLPALTSASVHHYTITLKDRIVEVAPGIHYSAWTFDGSAPGPVIHVRQGDMVDVELVNGGAIPHSIDFHAARIAPNRAFKDIKAGETFSFDFTANDPGVFMYHCGTPPVLAHIASGMYGAIVVDPVGGWQPKADRSYVLVGSEWYLNGDGKTEPAGLDMDKARHQEPDFVTWNGYAGQYKTNPLEAEVGENVRFFVVAAGPSFDTDFHVVGTLLDRAWTDGDPQHVLTGAQTVLVPAGGGSVFDVHFDEDGLYPFVSHSFAAVDMGQVGLVNVGDVKGTMSH